MASRCVHPRSIRSVVDAIYRLNLESSIVTYEAIAQDAELSIRHLSPIVVMLLDQQILRRTLDQRWRGPGVRYLYEIDIDKAVQRGYLRRIRQGAEYAA